MADVLKDKEEVKEFIKNLGIEYRFSCYSEKNAEGCQLLADYLTQIDNDYEKANKVLKENCDVRNYGRSCSNYGQNLLNGRGCIKNHKEALNYYIKGCEQFDAIGCDSAGKILAGFEPSLIKHIEPDVEKGLQYLLRGCNLNSAVQLFESSESCYAAAFIYGSSNKVIAKDEQKAIELGTKSCEMGQFRACKLVSLIYEKLNNHEKSKIFLDRYNQLKKQITDNLEIEMQRV